MIKHKLIILFITFSLASFGQTDSSWTVLLKKTNVEFASRSDMSSYSEKGFFLYENCLYDYILENNKQYSGRLIEVKKDTLCFANYKNTVENYDETDKFDTLKIHYKQMVQILLVKNWSKPSYKKISLDQYEFIFVKDTANFKIESIYGYTFLHEEADNVLIPRLTKKGIKYFFEYKGKYYAHTFHSVEYKPNFLEKHLRYDPVSNTIYFEFNLNK